MKTKARVFCLGPRLTAHAGVKHHDLWVDLAKLFVAKADSFGCPGREVLHNDIRPLHHSVRDREAFLLGEVDGNAHLTLVHVRSEVSGRDAGLPDKRGKEAQGIEAFLGLDAQDRGPKVCEVFRDDRPCGDPRKVRNLEPFEDFAARRGRVDCRRGRGSRCIV